MLHKTPAKISSAYPLFKVRPATVRAYEKSSSSRFSPAIHCLKVWVGGGKVGCCFFEIHRGNPKKAEKSKAGFLMFAKFDVEKISATTSQAFEKKEQKVSAVKLVFTGENKGWMRRT